MDNNNNYDDHNNFEDHGDQSDYSDYSGYSDQSSHSDYSDYSEYGDYNEERPRKRVSRKTLRTRQLTALAVIGLLVLILIVLLAKACSGDKKDSGETKKKQTTSTTQTTTSSTADPSATSTTTSTAPISTADPSLSAQVKLDKYTMQLYPGEMDMAWIQGYPEGSYEENEVWNSSDPRIATVDGWGQVTAVSPGECYILLTFDNAPGVEVQIKVTVYPDEGQAAPGGETPAETPDPNALPDTDAEPQAANVAEAPAPAVENVEGLHYFQDILIANKSYSLPETYDPGMDPICEKQFEALTDAAAKEGLKIYKGTGYRSYSDQVVIYNNYVTLHGEQMADVYSERPGFSEHQTGLVVDCNSQDDSFGYTPEAKWLEEHAHEYGFIIRYPKGKEGSTGHSYEPGHLRYLGKEKATDVYESGLSLEEYLGIDSYYH